PWEFEEYFVDGATDQNGLVELPVFSGIPYEVRSGRRQPEGPSVTAEDQFISPGVERVTPIAGEVTIVRQQLLAPNFTVQVSPKIVSANNTVLDAKDAQFIGCGVRTSNDQKSGSRELASDGTLTLSVYLEDPKRSNTLGIGCHAVFPGPSVGEPGFQFFGRGTVTTKRGQESTAVEVTLTAIGDYFDSTTEEFTPSQAQTFHFRDGKTRLRAGAGAFGANEDNDTGSLTIESATGWQVGDEIIPLTAWDITPEVGDEVIETPDQTVELCFDISEETLNEYGVSIESVRVARYDEEEERWIVTESTVSETEAGYELCGELDHFSIWGSIIDVIEELRSSVPSTFRISKRSQKGKLGLRWKEPEGVTTADTLTYEIQYSTKVRKKGKCEELQSFPKSKLVTSIRTKIRARKKNYCARVRVDQGIWSFPKFRKLQ
ncbi:MAG: hypothetical protein KDD60_09175, partial [Bdellovibrionales bacterium]|nr:hypothetical protein [Bdellovibrionales bacterium]